MNNRHHFLSAALQSELAKQGLVLTVTGDDSVGSSAPSEQSMQVSLLRDPTVKKSKWKYIVDTASPPVAMVNFSNVPGCCGAVTIHYMHIRYDLTGSHSSNTYERENILSDLLAKVIKKVLESYQLTFGLYIVSSHDNPEYVSKILKLAGGSMMLGNTEPPELVSPKTEALLSVWRVPSGLEYEEPYDDEEEYRDVEY